MPKSLTKYPFLVSRTLLNIVFSFIIFTFVSQSTNTHQSLIVHGPHLFSIQILPQDQVQVNIFGVNGQYQIIVSDRNQQTNQTYGKSSVCFVDQRCSLQFTAKQQFEAIFYIDVEAYKYSYEIIINNKTIKSEKDVRSSFLGQKFIYSKFLKPSVYTFRVFYQHPQIQNITLMLMQRPHVIKSNNLTEVQLRINQSLPFYQFYFVFSLKNFDYLLKQNIKVTVQIPNQMIKGCNGNNSYDIITRTCLASQYKYQDSIYLHKIGYYPSFQIKQYHRVQIKITILQFTKWRQIFDNQSLTLYISNSSDPKIFKGLTFQQINSRFRTKQVCNFKILACTFVFKLQPGNYTIFPLFSGQQGAPLVYLFQRSDQTALAQAFYSVLPTLGQDKTYHFYDTLMQFQTLKQKTVQFQIECSEQFIITQYQIFYRSNITNENGQYLLGIYQMSIIPQFQQSLNIANIVTQLEPNQAYLLNFMIISKQKYKQLKKLQDKQQQMQQSRNPTNNQKNTSQILNGSGKLNQQDEQIQLSKQPRKNKQTLQNKHYSVGLDIQILQVKVKNGRIPHKKIIENRLSEQIDEDSVAFQYYIYIGLGTIVVLTGLYLYRTKKICKKNINNIQEINLVSQKSVSDKIGSSTIQISEITKTQNQS